MVCGESMPHAGRRWLYGAQYDVIYFIVGVLSPGRTWEGHLRGTRNVDGPKGRAEDCEVVADVRDRIFLANRTKQGLGWACRAPTLFLLSVRVRCCSGPFSLPCLSSAACSPERTSRRPPRGATTAPTVSTALSSQTTTQASLRPPPRPMSRPTGQCPRTQMQAIFSIQTRHAKIMPTGHL